jgi:hypothetical protein
MAYQQLQNHIHTLLALVETAPLLIVNAKKAVNAPHHTIPHSLHCPAQQIAEEFIFVATRCRRRRILQQQSQYCICSSESYIRRKKVHRRYFIKNLLD